MNSILRWICLLVGPVLLLAAGLFHPAGL